MEIIKMTISYHRISTILAKAKVNSKLEAYRLPIIKKMHSINSEAVYVAIDYYFNNDNYPLDISIDYEVNKLMYQ
jgi:hypothetical protein